VNAVGNDNHINFDPFSLDPANERLWRGSRAIRLRPKAFAVLEYLLGRPGQLVTKETLLDAVWQGTFVGEAVLKVAIRQIREALDDDPKSPRFIETAHRRGYRFVGHIEGDGGRPGAARRFTDREAVAGAPLPAADLPRGFVGRDGALSRLRGWLEKMRAGERQIVFVTGEAGIGKTTLIDTFARSVASDRSIRIGRGQCLEQYGTGEAYLPVLEAIGRLCREDRPVVDVLRAHAPMWLLQMPSLVSAAERESLNREVFGATRERMLREMGEALEALTVETPLVLVLEDLHWSDYSTLDLISYLARQRQAAHLMVIGTYRAADVIASGHPLKAVKQELLARHQCGELPLEYLDEDAVAQYLASRFPVNRFPTELAALIHERTEGNPLFMVNTIDYLVAETLIGEHEDGWRLVAAIDNVRLGVPDSIRHMIEKQVDHLDADDRRTLEAASVAGAEFSVLGVAAGLAEDMGPVEARCEDLARRKQFIHDAGVELLPNGDAVGRYGFVHALYRHVLYERVPASRRVQLHRKIAERGELLYGERASVIAAELAMHFERAANYDRAARYLQQAGANAIRRFAYREAVVLSRRGLELLAKLPDTTGRAQLELQLQIALGVSLIATEGYAAPSVGRVYLKARQLCRQLGETPEISQVLWGLWTFHTLRADLATAIEIAEEFLRLSERFPHPELAMRGHWAIGITFMHLGECSRTMEHFDKALSLYDPDQNHDDALLYAPNPGVAMRCFAAWSLWFLGRPDQAVEWSHDGLTLARRLSEPHSLAHALLFRAILHQLRREERLAEEHADAAIAVATEHGLVMYQAMATTARGWTQIGSGREEEAVEQIRQGLAAQQTTGARLVRPHFLALLSSALEKAGRADEALRVLEEALAIADATGERYYQAELHRLKGEQVIARARRPDVRQSAGGRTADSESSVLASAERCFMQSIEIAQQQKARSLEMRAAMSLARLHRDQRKRESALALLRQTYHGFTEGFETVDLREAKALLDELS
jgi:DNA-binding winged helix-turn-helix (wHTH) protein/predicted ATPase